MKILQRTPQGLFFMHETDTGSREWLLPSEVVVFTNDWQLVNASDSTKDGWKHWVSPTETDAAKFINSLITEE